MCSKIQRILTRFDDLIPNGIYLIESLTFERYTSYEKYLYLYKKVPAKISLHIFKNSIFTQFMHLSHTLRFFYYFEVDV